jgi:hypothetical protein
LSCPNPKIKNLHLSVGGNEGGPELGLGDEGEKLTSRAFHLKLTPMDIIVPLP